MTSKILLLATLFITTVTLGQTEIKGMKIGDTRKDVETALASNGFAVTDAYQGGYSFRVESLDSVKSRKHPPSAFSLSVKTTADKQFTIANQPTVEGFAIVDFTSTNTLGKIEMEFKDKDDAAILSALVAKFGEPTSKTSETLANGFGVTVTSETYMWKLADAGIRLKTNCYVMGKTTLIVVGFNYLSEAANRRAKAAESNSKDL